MTKARTSTPVSGWATATRTARGCLAIATAVVVFATLAGPAEAGVPQATEERVFRALGLGRVSADYVVLVDTSGSMQANGLYGKLKPSLLDFLAALSAHDHLSLISFDTAPRLLYSGRIGPSRLAGLRRFSNRAGSSASRAPIVRRLPQRAAGEKTDIGSAIDAALAEVERPRASEIPSIIMFTDGRHDPPAGSRYRAVPSPNRVLPRGSWQALARRGDAIGRERLVSSYAMALTANTDAAALRRILDDTTVVALPRGQMRYYLNRVKHDTRVQKARSLVQRDLDATISVQWPETLEDLDPADASFEATIRVESDAARVPFVITNPRFVSSDPDVGVANLRDRLVVRPGAEIKVALRLSWSRAQSFGLGKRVEQIADGEALRFEHSGITSPWSRVLTGFDLRPRPRIGNGETAMTIVGEVGWSWSKVLVIALLLAALLAAAAYRWFQTHARMTGVLLLQEPRPHWQTMQHGLPPRPSIEQSWISVPLEGRSVSVGPSNGLSAGRGRVRARHSFGGRRLRRPPELVITYSNDGSRRRMKTRTCRPGSAVLINGTVFSHQSDAAASAMKRPGSIPVAASL